jgi:hypothetical protein
MPAVTLTQLLLLLVPQQVGLWVVLLARLGASQAGVRTPQSNFLAFQGRLVILGCLAEAGRHWISKAATFGWDWAQQQQQVWLQGHSTKRLVTAAAAAAVLAAAVGCGE